MRLDGKVAIVTGAGSGIGRAVCDIFAREGAAIGAADIDPATADEVAAGIEAAGGRSLSVHADITDAGDIQVMVEKVVDRFGSLDILVNNAGRRIVKPFLEHTEEEWRQMLDLNLTGHFLCCKAGVPHMLKAGGGRIVNVASIAGLVGRAKRVGYCAAKGGLLAFTRALAADLAEDNIRVNAVNPGLIETGLNAAFAVDPVIGPQWAKGNLLNRWGQPDDIAEAVLFLASDESSFMTGEYINLDGGSVAAMTRSGEEDPAWKDRRLT
jgi:NAD(P)-dependent dehydrogenase (short-subunit alcohol dehydrogenase family)